MTTRLIGVIADTHGLIRPEALAALRGSELIVHAGDVGSPQVLTSLRAIAPVVAVRGNTDTGEWAQTLPRFEIVDVGPLSLYVLHDLGDLDLDPAAAGLSAVISGHSHLPSLRSHRGVLLINPGSAGPRRFDSPISVALIRVKDRMLTPQLIELSLGVEG